MTDPDDYVTTTDTALTMLAIIELFASEERPDTFTDDLITLMGSIPEDELLLGAVDIAASMANMAKDADLDLIFDLRTSTMAER